MDKFDLFDLVHMQDIQKFLKEYFLYQATLYTLFASSVNNIITNKNQQSIINTKTIKLLKDSVKNILISNMDQINY